MNRNRWMDLFKNEQGSILIIVVAGMLMILGMSALVIDVGITMREKQKLDNAVDAAVLAGIHYIHDEEEAFQTAADYLQANLNVALTRVEDTTAIYGDDADPTAVIEMQISDNSLFISYEKDSPLYFGKIFGKDVWGVRAKAKALRAPVNQVEGIIPFGVQEREYDHGFSYVIEGAEFEASSYYGLLDLEAVDENVADANAYDEFNECIQDYRASGGHLDSGGGHSISDYIVCGYPGSLKIGDSVPTKTGNTGGQVYTYVRYLIESSNQIDGCKDNQFPGLEGGCPRKVLVPVINVTATSKKGNNQVPSEVKIVGFSSFWIESVIDNGNNAKINAKFIEHTTISADFDDPDALVKASDSGTYAVKLIE